MLAARAVSTRPAEGGLVIAGGDPASRRRLLTSLARTSRARPILDVATPAGLERELAALVPSVVLFDLGAGADERALGSVSALSALAKTIVIADGDDEALAVRALKAGASGFCPRSTPPALILKAVQLVEVGEIWVGRRVMLRLVEELASAQPPPRPDAAGERRLTARERAVAGLVARGAGNKEIAERLGISVKTVKTHLTSTFKKLKLSSRLQLGLAMGAPEGLQTKV